MEFFIGGEQTLEFEFIRKLSNRPFWRKLDNASNCALRLFNNASYICTLIHWADYPPLHLKEYFDIAQDGHEEPIWKDYICPATLALVVNWLNSKECYEVWSDERGGEEIQVLCKETCEAIKKMYLCVEGRQEDFQALINIDSSRPSGFIKKGEAFNYREPLEIIEAPDVSFDDIVYSFDYIIDKLKEISETEDNNYEKSLKGFIVDLKLRLNKVPSGFNDQGSLERVYDIIDRYLGVPNVGNKASEGNLSIPSNVISAFNGQTGQPCFTSKQMGILLTAVGRLTEKDNPPGKTTLGDVVQRIAGYKSKTANANMKGQISEEEKKTVYDVLKEKFPNLADEVMKVF